MGSGGLGENQAEAGARQIAQVQCTDRMVLLIDDQQRDNFEIVHDIQRFRRQHIRGNGFAICGHHAADQCGVNIDAGVDFAAQIAVGKNAEQDIVAIDDGCHRQAFRAHFQQCATERRIRH